jgi:hypothetical protein
MDGWTNEELDGLEQVSVPATDALDRLVSPDAL